MKKIFSIAIALLMSVMVFAQESNFDANGNRQYGPYQTNAFFDNWFVEVGGGINTPHDALSNIFRKDASAEADFGGLMLYGNVGKWIDPCYGVRLGWQGLTSTTLGDGDNEFVWFPNKENDVPAFHYIHGDFMVNVSNLFAGYKENRAIDIVPYLTTGVLFNKYDKTLALGGGIQFPIRVSNVVKIVPQVQTLALNDAVFGGESVSFQNSASIGVRINLGKNNFHRSADDAWAAKVAAAEAAAAAALAARQAVEENYKNLATEHAKCPEVISQLKAENDALKDENAALLADRYGFDPEVFYFAIGKATLSETEIAHFNNFVATKLGRNDKIRVLVTGSTDSQTGSAKRNEQLAKNRADYIVDLLEKAGITGSQIEVTETRQDIGATPELSRAAIVAKK